MSADIETFRMKCTKIKDIFYSIKENPSARKVDELMEAIESHTPSIAFLGERGTGKSSLINKLLKENILPIGPMQTTHCRVNLKYGNKASYKFNGKVFDYSFEELRQLIEKQECEVDVFLPNLELKNLSVTLIDEPGIDTSIVKNTQNIILPREATIHDYIIFVVRADRFMGALEKTFFKALTSYRGVNSLIVIITMLDLVRPREYSRIISHIDKIMSKMCVDYYYSIEENEIDESIAGHGWNNCLTHLHKCKEGMKYNESRFQQIQKECKKTIVDYLNSVERCKKIHSEIDSEKLECLKARMMQIVEDEKLSFLLYLRNRIMVNKKYVMRRIKEKLHSNKVITIKNQTYLANEASIYLKNLVFEIEKHFNLSISKLVENLNFELRKVYKENNVPPINITPQIKNCNDYDIYISLQLQNKNDDVQMRKYMKFGLVGITLVSLIFKKIIPASICIIGGMVFFEYLSVDNVSVRLSIEKKLCDLISKTYEQTERSIQSKIGKCLELLVDYINEVTSKKIDIHKAPNSESDNLFIDRIKELKDILNSMEG